MSRFFMLPVEACFDKRIIPQCLRVLAIISSHAGRDKISWCSYKTLAAEAGLSRRVIIQYVSKLIECGYLKREVRHNRDGGRASNMLTVVLDMRLNVEVGGDAGQHHKDVAGQHEGGDAGQHEDRLPDSTPYKELKPLNYKNRTKDKCISLQAWEEKVGSQLCPAMMKSWLIENKISGKVGAELIVDFRERMIGGGKEFVDFKLVFQNWLRRGYLMLTMDGARLKSKQQATSMVVEKGLTL